MLYLLPWLRCCGTPTLNALSMPILFSQLHPNTKEEEEKEEERAEEGKEEEEEEDFIPPPSTVPAILSRAGRKRAPTMKALEAEKAPKRGAGQGRAGRGRGRGSRGGKQAKE